MVKAGDDAGFDEALLTALPDSAPPGRKRLFLSGLITLAIVMALISAMTWASIQDKKSEIVAVSKQRLILTAQGKAEVLSTWLEAKIGQANRVATSDFFRMFATDIAANEGDLSAILQPQNAPFEEDAEDPLAASLVDQLPMLERILTDFSLNAGIEAAYLVALDGTPYLATAVSPSLSETGRILSKKAVERKERAYGLPYLAEAGLVMDVAVPIISSQASLDSDQIVSILILTVPIGAGIELMMESSPLSKSGEVHAVMIPASSGLYILSSGAAKPAGPVKAQDYRPQPKQPLAFSLRNGLITETASYSVALPVQGPEWWILREYPQHLALAPLRDFSIIAIAFALALLGLISGLFAALWWRLASHHSRELAKQFHDLAGRIDAQRRFLDAITSHVREWIALKDERGTYRFVNRAFADALRRDIPEILGSDDFSLFGASVAEHLAQADRAARDTRRAITDSWELPLPRGRRLLQFCRVAYHDTDDRGQPTDGLLIVARDITEITAAQRRHQEALQQMSHTLVRAIELRDPYLAGHSRRVCGFAVAVAQELGLSESDRTALEIAANLSQIGKLAVPRDLLTKPERLTDNETTQMERHVEHACHLLKDIDFGVPVLDSLAQMHERLDGSGYPKGLKGADISINGRVLAVCDVFCARIESRGYRPVISVSKALKILAEHPNRYDKDVVMALSRAISSIAGEKLIAGVAQSG